MTGVGRSRRGTGAHLEQVQRIDAAVRSMGAQSVIISRAVADRFNLHTTDLEVLDLVLLGGPMSAGEIGQATGLTSGSVTALIDRLARARLVERCKDARDGRRVLVRVRKNAVAPIAAIYRRMQKEMFKLWSSYSMKELKVIEDFLVRSTLLSIDCTKAITTGAQSACLTAASSGI